MTTITMVAMTMMMAMMMMMTAGFLIAVSFCILSPPRQNIAQGSDAEDNVWAVINYDDDDGDDDDDDDDDGVQNKSQQTKSQMMRWDFVRPIIIIYPSSFMPIFPNFLS